jgi:hypothetical protein
MIFTLPKNLNFNKEELHVIGSRTFCTSQQDSIKRRMTEVTSAYYETAKMDAAE